MSLKPQVGIDLDGVVCNFMEGFLKISRKLFHKPSKGWVQRYWDVEVLSKEEMDRMWRHIKHTRNFWMSLEKLENTNALMRRQKEMNLFFLTTRVPSDGLSVMEQSMEWLARQYCIPGAYVAVTNEKGKECKALNIEYFIDDKPENCLDIVKNSSRTKVFLQDATYNRTFTHSKVERVANLNEYIRTILD